MGHLVYPFSAFVGQERVKKALLLNLIDPRLGGVLIVGPKGSGKTSIVRSLEEILPNIERVKGCPFNCNPKEPANLCSLCRDRLSKEGYLPSEEVRMRIIELPLSATEDNLIGTLDIEETLKRGEKVLSPGLLAEANQNILYIDGVNLLPDHLVDCILDPVASGWNIIQREGLTFSHPTRFILIASMNPEEGEIRPQILDRFALSVEMEKIDKPKIRGEIIRRSMAFEEDPIGFRKLYEDEQENLRRRIIEARKILPQVEVSDEILSAVAEVCAELKIEGFRADLAIVKAARALAAFKGRLAVKAEDVLEVFDLVLGHRIRRGGQVQLERHALEKKLMSQLSSEGTIKRFDKQPTKPEEAAKVEAPQGIEPLKAEPTEQRRQKEISLLPSLLIMATLILFMSLSISAFIFLFKIIIFGMPPGGIGEILTLDQFLLIVGFSSLLFTIIMLLRAFRAKRPAVFFYAFAGTGLRRRIVQVQHEEETPDEVGGKEVAEKLHQLNVLQKIINIPLQASLSRIYKVILNKGPKILEKTEAEKGRKYNFLLRRRRERRLRVRVGKHARVEARSERGRYVSYEFPRRKPWDIALGPTLRAAAPYQILRRTRDDRMVIKVEDIRVKVRESKAPLTIVLLLDASESVSASLPNIRRSISRLYEVSYKKRDRVGLVVFKGSGAIVLQPPTSNLNLLIQKLREVGASGLTPLAAGMLQSWRLLRNEKIRNKDAIPVLVIVSDGIANVPLTTPLSLFTRGKFFNHAQADVIDVAFLLRREGIRTLVINPSHAPIGEEPAATYKAEILEKTGKIWLEPTELLLHVAAITGGYYYGIGEGGEIDSAILEEAFMRIERDLPYLRNA